MRCPPNLPQYGWYLGYPGLDLERGRAELRVVPPRPRHPRHHVWEVPHQTYRLSHGAHTLDDWYLVWPHCAVSHKYPTMIFRQEWSPSSSESRIWILPFFEGDHLSPFYWSCNIDSTRLEARRWRWMCMMTIILWARWKTMWMSWSMQLSSSTSTWTCNHPGSSLFIFILIYTE